MLVSVVCDGVRVRVHVYWRTEVVEAGLLA